MTKPQPDPRDEIIATLQHTIALQQRTIEMQQRIVDALMPIDDPAFVAAKEEQDIISQLAARRAVREAPQANGHA